MRCVENHDIAIYEQFALYMCATHIFFVIQLRSHSQVEICVIYTNGFNFVPLKQTGMQTENR